MIKILMPYVYSRPYVYSFCPIFPGPTFISCPTSILNSRVCHFTFRQFVNIMFLLVVKTIASMVCRFLRYSNFDEVLFDITGVIYLVSVSFDLRCKFYGNISCFFT